MKLILAVLLTALLAACATTGGAALTPQQSIYQLKSDYNTALQIAVTYKNLPPCGPAAPPVCSKPDVVAKLQQADNVAFPAIQAAENTLRTPGAGANQQTALNAANQALAALTAITSTLATK